MLSPERFAEFFSALHGGSDPFPWQQRLADRLVQAKADQAAWPDALALPTASGKTACIDIALFALAAQFDLPANERTAPRRIFFVVDRRVIVDEAFERAWAISKKLEEAQDGILKEVADRLRLLAGGAEEHPLAVFQLRGGVYRDDAWARTPLQPTVVASTVDQIGSRLLFRGYGLRSGSMWPVHAGLAANDSLILLDEAHCANPFRQTMEAIQQYRGWQESGAPHVPETPFHFVQLSATPTAGVTDIFGTESADREHEVLGARLRASKPCALVEAKQAKGKQAGPKLAQELAKQARNLVDEDRKTVAVIVNRVATAREVYEGLAKEKKADAVLMTGRMRPMDRDQVIGEVQEALGSSRASRGGLDRPLYVVATQCLEVGADLDFDAMVSECASLDALRQRFGRLNRTGRNIQARGVVVVRGDQTDPKKTEDPVYGAAVAATWQWLKDNATEYSMDFGVENLAELVPEAPEAWEELNPPAPDAPVMLPAHVDAWAQTSPAPAPEPEAGIFLRGADRSSPEVQVCWRGDLRWDPDKAAQHASEVEAEWIDRASYCPPSSVECLPVPLALMRQWLEGRSLGPLTDVEGGAPETDSEEAEPVRAILCWRGPEDSRLVRDPRQIRPGDTVVIPAQFQGWEALGHIPRVDSEGLQASDMGDRAHLSSRAKPVLRIYPEWLATFEESEARTGLEAFLKDPGVADKPAELLVLLRELAGQEGAPPWLEPVLASLESQPRLEIGARGQEVSAEESWLVLWGRKRDGNWLPRSITFSGEDHTSSATVGIALAEHLRGVEAWARRFAEGVGLPEGLVRDLALAGRIHDLGKADPRFQALLHGGNPWMAFTAGPLLAKSGAMPQGYKEWCRAREQSGYPEGARHELLSVRLAENSPSLLGEANDPALVLHLVASHHGWCRPLAPVVWDLDPEEVVVELDGEEMWASSATGLERLDSGIAERFWQLIRRYGWWRLAWLEALLRLADHRRSEWEQTNRAPDAEETSRGEEATA